MVRWILMTAVVVLLGSLIFGWRRRSYLGSDSRPSWGWGRRGGRARRRELHEELEDELAVRRGIADWRREQAGGALPPDVANEEKHS